MTITVLVSKKHRRFLLCLLLRGAECCEMNERRMAEGMMTMMILVYLRSGLLDNYKDRSPSLHTRTLPLHMPVLVMVEGVSNGP